MKCADACCFEGFSGWERLCQQIAGVLGGVDLGQPEEACLHVLPEEVDVDLDMFEFFT